MTEPLAIAFVWHMHQPYYKSSRAGAFDMPWVRLHALKDYLDMVELLSHYPALHQTFNLVPSLVEQLEDYAGGHFSDLYWDMTLKPAEELDPSERAFVVNLMCERSWHPRAQRYPRYLELARRKESCSESVDACAAAFSHADIRDLQVWFTLAWFDPEYLRSGALAELVERGRDYTEDDKTYLAAAQADILAKVLPAYRDAEARGQVELSTSPYFHPILPLLINTDVARVARGDIALPTRRFAHPEDAREQVRRAIDSHADTFGSRPRGMWCSEQSVGEDVIGLLAESGIGWTISDESVLGRSLGLDITRNEQGHVQVPDLLYRPYRLEREGRRLDIIFRDHTLSDLLGFTYQSWAPRDAAANLVWRLREARKNLANTRGPHLVTIALDGENAWEYYQEDGREFLALLYESLAADPGFRCVTVSEFLAEIPPPRELPWLHSGSWINADFSTWIGDPAHSRAWEHLHRARDAVAARRAAAPPPSADPASAVAAAQAASVVDLDEAWNHILVAEGSDWFWWFGIHQQSGIDHVWDLAFRRHLQEAYRCVGERPPAELSSPILTDAAPAEATPPTARFTPVVDGRISWPEEWSAAGSRRAPLAGAMQTAEAPVIEEVRFGRDEHNLYLLLDPGSAGFPTGTHFAVYFAAPSPAPDIAETLSHTRFHDSTRADQDVGFDLAYELGVRLEDGQARTGLATVSGDQWGEPLPLGEGAADEVVELALPLLHLGVSTPVCLDFVVAAVTYDRLVQLLPPRGSVHCDLAATADRRRSTDQP